MGMSMGMSTTDTQLPSFPPSRTYILDVQVTFLTPACPPPPASLMLVISGVVTISASLAGEMALMKPTSMPAGQSMRMNW